MDTYSMKSLDTVRTENSIRNIQEALADLEAKLLKGERGTIETSLRRLENSARQIRRDNKNRI